MQHIIELDTDGERRLRALAKKLGADSESAGLDAVLEAVTRRIEEMLSAREDPIRSTPEVLGGDACIRKTRIPVWLLVSYKSQGMSDTDLLANYPDLSASDLTAAWDYFAAHSEEILKQRQRHQEAA